MRKVAFHTLGCKVNIYETEAMQELMQKAGYEIVDFDRKADIYVINTCSVTNVADKKSRQLLHRAKAENPEALIVAAGCYVQSAAKKLQEDNKIDVIIGNNRKKDIVSIIEAHCSLRREGEQGAYILDIAKTKEYEDLAVTKLSKHTRAFIKVQDGCNQFCSYCIIPYTRGRVRSRNCRDVVEEARKLAAGGFRELVLTGIHLSSYGADLQEGEDLLRLIQALGKVEGIERIRVGSLEPRIITPAFLEGLKEVPQFCPHFHLSLQSGCDKTLRNMNRKYSSADFRAGAALIRAFYESPALTTDVIVGFPGESEEDFQISKDFIAEMEFYETHIFPYSAREGTKAASMKEQLSQREKAARAKELALLHERQFRRFLAERIGKREEILLEEEAFFRGRACAVGYTREYVKVAVPIEGDMAAYGNRLAIGEITGEAAEDVLWMPVFTLF